MGAIRTVKTLAVVAILSVLAAAGIGSYMTMFKPVPKRVRLVELTNLITQSSFICPSGNGIAFCLGLDGMQSVADPGPQNLKGKLTLTIATQEIYSVQFRIDNESQKIWLDRQAGVVGVPVTIPRAEGQPVLTDLLQAGLTYACQVQLDSIELGAFSLWMTWRQTP